MTRPTDAALLCELASKTLNDSAYAINTNDLQGAAKRLRDTLGYVERLIQASGTPGIQGNAGHLVDEFAGYSINDPYGLEKTPVIGNAGTPVDEFADYDINAL